MQSPPKAAAVGMYLSSSFFKEDSLWPWMKTCWAFKFLATSRELDPLISIHQFRARQKLHHQTRGDDGPDTELHARSPVRGHNHTLPIERIRSRGGVNPVERELTAHEENEEGDGRVENLFPERNPPLGRRDLGKQAHEGLDQVEHLET